MPSAERLHFELRDALCREYRRQLRTLWNHWDSFAAEQIRREYADALPQGATVYDVTYAVAREWRRVVNLVQPGLWFAMRSVEWKELE